ncbi:MAG: hypothetical protein AAGA23_14495 [Pseudomonadota bacterium]
MPLTQVIEFPLAPHGSRRESRENLAELENCGGENRRSCARFGPTTHAVGRRHSYPTIRLRLDRLIDKINLIESADASGFEQTLRAGFADGRLDRDLFDTLLAAYRAEQEKRS